MTKLIVAVGFCIALSVSAIATGATTRTWSSADGKFQVEAELLQSNDTAVQLRRADGRVVTVPLKLLSTADRQYLASQAQASPEGPSAASAASAEKAKQILQAKGIRVLSSGFVLPGESELNDGLKNIFLARKTLVQAANRLALIDQRMAQGQQQIIHLTQINMQLNAKLARVQPDQPSLNNKLVGAIRANQNQIQLIQQGRTQLETQQRAARTQSNEAREKYVQEILDLRKSADETIDMYTELGTEPAVRAAVVKLNAGTGKSYSLSPSRSFLAAEKRLKSLEDTVLSETIQLRRGNTDSLYVSVVINGKHAKEMVVDSGANLISLPHALAKECGIEATSSDPKIVLVMADGSRISGHQITIPEVRVGKFTLKNVRAAVLGPEAVAAEALLGMSFLGAFKFEINAQNSTLSMVKIDEDSGK